MLSKFKSSPVTLFSLTLASSHTTTAQQQTASSHSDSTNTAVVLKSEQEEMAGMAIILEDCQCDYLEIKSSWKDNVKVQTKECQTPIEFYQFQDMEIQTGLDAEILEEVVNHNDAGYTLSKILTKYQKKYSNDEWNQFIRDGKVGIDGEVILNPDLSVESDQYIEFVNITSNAQTQVVNTDFGTQTDEPHALSKSEENLLMSFLNRILPVVEHELEANNSSTAFNGYHLLKADGTDSIALWRVLTVDLEKHKVVYPDWSKGNHYPGVIVKCDLTRNKERIYDIDLSDGGGRLIGVREEYIRAIVSPELDSRGMRSSATAATSAAKKNLRLAPGMRLHACVKKSSSGSRFLPGRVTAAHRNGTIDVECEGGVVKTGLSYEEVLVGLQEGQEVEARRPVVMPMQCTGISWSCNGSMVVASYGNPSGSGWCDSPGAVCTWSLFSRDFNPSLPENVLDHPVCLMCVKCHPLYPSLLAAGSFNGEVIVWDVNSPESPIKISPIVVESHEDPVMSVDWVYDPTAGAFVVASLGADGKLLLWNLDQSFQKPTRGALLSKSKVSKKRTYPPAHGGTSFSFSYGLNTRRPQWLLVAQEGGAIVRTQASRILNAPMETSERRGVTSYPSLSRQGDAFQHDPHIGPVNSLQFSPFHRNLFLTGGQDGSVRLYHLLEQTPLRQWEPSPPPSSAASGADGEGETDDINLFAAISCVSFSYTRPTVFAVGTQDGHVYLFDLLETLSGPLTFLRLPLSGAGVGAGGGAGGGAGAATGTRGKRHQGAGVGAGVGYRPRVTGLAFNSKQRDLLSVCDSSGRVLVWKVGWNLANQRQTEMSFLEKLGNISSSDSASGERQEEAQQREEDRDRERERERDAKGTEED